MSKEGIQEFFTPEDQYNAMLHKGLSVSGETKNYFAHGRVNQLKRIVDEMNIKPKTILDFGCGLGDTTYILNEAFAESFVMGVDPSANYISNARFENRVSSVDFKTEISLKEASAFDVCYVNGVFHHIKPDKRMEALAAIRRSLKKGAILAFFENNIMNPGTRIVMHRIPFDRDAQPFTHYHAKKLLRAAGFTVLEVRFLFIFPNVLSFLRPIERYLDRLPFGAQYCIIAENNEA
ncbi:MAG: class I SAM-dependent methyltransferase [Bacteroidota bacterium]